MGYDTIKSGIATRLNTLGYTESSQAIDFKNAPASEYGMRYIIKSLSGENQEGNIIDRSFDLQEWQIQIAFERSAQNDITELDALHRAKDLFIKDIEKPSNWAGVAQKIMYKSWEVAEFPNYFVLMVRLEITDIYTY